MSYSFPVNDVNHVNKYYENSIEIWFNSCQKEDEESNYVIFVAYAVLKLYLGLFCHDQVSSGKCLAFLICDAIYRFFEIPWSLEQKTKL